VATPVGVPVSTVAVNVNVTFEVTTTGFGATVRVSSGDCFTTWINAGERLDASLTSPE